MDTSKLKPFNLERALAGDPVVTRNGNIVNEIRVLKYATVNPVVFTVEGFSAVNATGKDGFVMSENNHHPYDLFMAPKTREVWVNLYETLDQNKIRGTEHSTKEDADRWEETAIGGLSGRLGNSAHKITIEDDTKISSPEKPRMVTKWIVIWKDMQGAIRTSHQLYDTMESAKEVSHNPGYIGAFPIYIPEEKLT